MRSSQNKTTKPTTSGRISLPYTGARLLVEELGRYKGFAGYARLITSHIDTQGNVWSVSRRDNPEPGIYVTKQPNEIARQMLEQEINGLVGLVARKKKELMWHRSGGGSPADIEAAESELKAAELRLENAETQYQPDESETTFCPLDYSGVIEFLPE